MTYAYAVLFIIGMAAFFYTSSKEFKKVDQALWTLIIMVQFINLGYVYLAMSQTPEAAAIANAFVAFEGTIYPVVVLYASLNAFKVDYSNLVKRILYMVGFAILIMIWHETGDGGFYIRSSELVHTPFGTMLREIPGPGMYMQFLFVVSIFSVATVLLFKNLLIEKKRVPKSIIIAFTSILVLEFIGYLIDTSALLNFYIAPFVYVLTLWITAIMYRKNLHYDVEELVSRMNKKSDTVHGYIAFDYNRGYLGSTLKAVELLPEVNDFIIDKKLSEVESSLGSSLIKAIDDFEQGDIKPYYLNRNDKIIRYDVSYYSRNGENIGYLIEFRDDTANQKALALVIEQEKLAEEAKIHKQHEQELRELFRETAEALAGAIDAKDEYTHGHSRRVAEYAMKIAIETGRNQEICENVYVAGLLHDVGKIGIRDAILTKAGRLTEEEFGVIKQHPNLGNNILSGISTTPYLSIGALYHHERYDGKGYPEGLKGEDIPEIARIIAVADSYDAMTSNRSYRAPLAQQKVREELAKGIGTQFDPEFAKAMIHILDKDTEYKLKDDEHFNEFLEQYTFEEYKKQCTDGIQISDCITRITFSYESSLLTLVFFDSLDGRIYTNEADQKKMEYTDFCDIPFGGDIVKGQIRDCRIKEYDNKEMEQLGKNEVIVETVRQRDHVWVKMYLKDTVREYTLALRDRSQFAYVAITGEQCKISGFKVKKSVNPADEGYIKRIVEEISYIKDCEEGDLRNLEIAGWREDHSEGVLIEGKVDISFHTMSLPAARRIWHCPIIVFFTSENGKIYGPGYREFALVRFDGESWEEDKVACNELEVSFGESFVNWEEWKAINKEGVDCTIHMERKEDIIELKANEAGVMIHNITKLSEDVPKLYCALTGDQVAITTIRIKKD